MPSVVEVSGLKKSYGNTIAVNNVSFSIHSCEVFGIVGPNGAGKTTIVECIEGLRSPDEGKISVLGRTSTSDQRIFKQVGVQSQESTMYNRIRVREALRLFASFYKHPLSPDYLLKEMDLKKEAGTFYGKLSGGEKRKLLTAIALIGNPSLVILDEPTSGLDPQSRYSFWTTLRKFRDKGLTILLTTHNLQEAEEECDTVCIIDKGKIIAIGTPSNLVQEYRLGMLVTAPIKDALLDRQMFTGLNLTHFELRDNRVYLYGTRSDFTTLALQVLQERGIHDITIRAARLEDLYLILTGREYKE